LRIVDVVRRDDPEGGGAWTINDCGRTLDFMHRAGQNLGAGVPHMLESLAGSSRKVSACFSLMLSLSGLSCTNDRTNDLYRRWVGGVKSGQAEIDRTFALVDYFASKWNAVSFDVMADYGLALQRSGGRGDRAWPFGEGDVPLAEQNAEARRIFLERYGLEAPFYFFPALKEYEFMAPPWADAVNFSHWQKVLKKAGLNSLDDVGPYLERRKAMLPITHRIAELLSEYPGCMLERLDTKRHYMEIRTDHGFLVSGPDDPVVADETELVYDLCKLDNSQFIVGVSSWEPWTLNPVDVIAAKELAGLARTPTLIAPLRANHQRRVNSLLRARGIVLRGTSDTERSASTSP
jgi:hypothetical protein